MISKIFGASIAVFGALFFSGTVVHAQATIFPEGAAPPASQVPQGTVNCFDYYHFGSVNVSVGASGTSSVAPGMPITFSGTITNANDYPIVAGEVYAKVFLNNKNTAEVQQSGYPLVDQFVVKDGITLAAHGAQPITFDWKVPQGAASGDYLISFFFVSAERYNLLGLSFTDDVVGGTTSFSVKGGSAKPVVIGKYAVTLNGKIYDFAKPLPHFTSDQAVTAHIAITNPGSGSATVSVSRQLYNWDNQRPENLKSEGTENVTLKAGETKTLSYDLAPTGGAVSYFVVELNDNGAKSIVDIRFVRDGIDETRINFPSILSYPLIQGQQETVFSCLHSTNMPVVSDNTLTITLKDMNNDVIHSYTYTGDVTGAMMGVKDVFTPSKTITNFTLTASLTHGGKVVDEVTQTYKCSEIDPALCQEANSSSSSSTADVLIVLGALIAALAGIYLSKKGKIPPVAPPPTAPLILALLLVSALFFGAPSVASANTVTWSTSLVTDLSSVNNGYLYCVYWNGSNCVIYAMTLPGRAKWITRSNISSVNITINHASTVTNGAGALLPDWATVNVGDTLTFTPIANQDTNINWNISGYAGDTPYGHWVGDGSISPPACTAVGTGDYFASWFSLGVTFYMYLGLWVNPTTPTTVTNTGTAGLSCTGLTCTVTSPGTIIAHITWPATTGNFQSSFDKINSYSPSFVNWFPRGCQSSRQVTNMTAATAAGCVQYTGNSTNSTADNNTNSCLVDPAYAYVLSVPAISTTHSLTAVAPPCTCAATGDTCPIKGYSCPLQTSTQPSNSCSNAGTLPLATGSTCSVYYSTCGTNDTGNYYILYACTAPTATISASPNPVAYGGSATLTWSSTKATSCTASGAWSGTKAVSGSVSTGALTTSATYSIQCTGPGGTSPLQSVTVSVNAAASCTATTISNCTLSATTSGGSSGSCASGYTLGSCSYTCNNGGTWSANSNSCALPASCASKATTWGSCSATQSTQSSGYSGSLSNTALSYTGSETASCSNSIWSFTNPSCTSVACANGANNAPTCNTCSAPNVYNGTSCVAPITITPNAVAPITLPTTSFTETYTLTGGSSTNTNCRLLDYKLNTLTSYAPCSGSVSYNAPSVAGTYGYYLQANKSSTGETVTSSEFVVTVNPAPTCANGANNYPTCNTCKAPLAWNGSSCITPSCSVKTASPSSINLGSTITLNWTCNIACTQIANSDGFVTGGAATGSGTARPTSSGTATYGMTCGGSSIYFNPVIVYAPGASISATPSRVPTGGGTSTITWSSTGVKSCTVSGPGLSSTLKSGSQAVTASTSSTYTITCTPTVTGSPVTSTATVNVGAVFQEF